jgi:hypothetical protein
VNEQNSIMESESDAQTVRSFASARLTLHYKSDAPGKNQSGGDSSSAMSSFEFNPLCSASTQTDVASL